MPQDRANRRPNIFIFMVDEQRYPTAYDSPELRAWMEQYLGAQHALRESGVDFRRHYTASTACAPSRTSIFTGQYPTLHGVTQTDGLAKHAWDPGMFWLDPNTVPTLGDYFRAGGYRTFYKGKWHISFADVTVPGTHDSVATNGDNGVPFPERTKIYENAERLEEFGFSGWIGPEPHGRDQSNCGWIRDPGYAQQTIELLDGLDNDASDEPWLIVNSFVNPHDIVFFGIAWKSFGYDFTDDTIPSIPEPPTQNENLGTKPDCQQSYIDVYPKMLLPQPPVELYRQFYYYLQKRADHHVSTVYERLKQSRFFDNTLIVYTSDHGEMLGAHGGAHQKWYNAYEETIHVPFIFSGPLVANPQRSVDQLTSHADIVPTLLGFAGVDVVAAQKKLCADHTEVRRLVGRDLSSVIRGNGEIANEPIYFMTSDDISRGLEQVTARRPYEPVVPPNQIETVVADIDGVTWKYSRYYDDSDPELPEQFEMYDITNDRYEEHNLALSPEHQAMREVLAGMLNEQRERKALKPIATIVASRKEGEGWSPWTAAAAPPL